VHPPAPRRLREARHRGAAAARRRRAR
jgi:hypothetical protein